ncbi:MAG TPA: cupin domain-containing protein [Vicinamibacterales bacterium]|nr:cupin domain-containing protein [Vicinamibacterales bacterium]HOQ60535.1 cupin domain-containing protein [Vicinamibacterales bacterium]HPK72807.1 cupin domain-containing protein [Vicinamibacterales bacterium]
MIEDARPAGARTEKPWGYELLWAKTSQYVGKIIHVNAGHALSLQYHRVKTESVYLAAGRVVYEIEEGGRLARRELVPGDHLHIPAGTVHRVTAIEDADIFEVSTPELDDVVRLEDRYGRARAPATTESGGRGPGEESGPPGA